MKSCVWLSVAMVFVGCLCVCSVGSTARAADNVAVLGVRSLDGDTDLERRLSTALRTSVSNVERFKVSDRELSLEQMSLAHGCDEPDARCLAEIAKTLAVDRLIYGTIVQPPSGGELTLHSFEARTGTMESASAPKLDPKLLAGSGALGAVTALVKRLAGEAALTTGRLRVLGRKPGSQIFVDGVPRGELDDKGVLTVELGAGKHFVLVTGARGVTEEHMALVSAGGTVEVQLTQSDSPAVADPSDLSLTELEGSSQIESRRPRSWRRALGWTSVGLGAAFAVATIYSWVRLGMINDDRDYLAYRNAFPRKGMPGAVADVCPEAERGTLAMSGDVEQARLERAARDLCKEGDQLEVLQYVFLGGTVLAGGAGAYLLWSAKESKQTNVSIKPRFQAQSALLEAELRF
jgi:hypothetical protein